MRLVQLKQAEVALASGRLEEARDLLASDELRSHRRGQRLLDRLIEAYMDRCENHLQAGRGPEALEACTQAQALAGQGQAVSDLRERVEGELARGKARRQQLARILSEAGSQIRRGRLTLAEGLLSGSQAGQDPVTRELQQRIAQRRSDAEKHLARFENGLASGQVVPAAEALARAAALCDGSEAIEQARSRLAEQARDAAGQALRNGRLDRAATILEATARLCGPGQTLDELLRAVEHCRLALQWLEQAQYRRAAQALWVVETLAGSTGWIRESRKRALAAAEAQEALLAGPLALLKESREVKTQPSLPPRRPSQDLPVPDDPPDMNRFCLQVDSAGSFLLARSSEVLVGPVGDTPVPDIALAAGSDASRFRLQRGQGQYVLIASKPVAVNGRAVTRAALRDGDKIALTPRCRLVFSQPNAASGTALLVPAGARFALRGITAAILMDREVLMGPGDQCHVVASLLKDRAVLTAGAEHLQCRTRLETVEAATGSQTDRICWNRPVRIGPVGLVMTKATP